MLYVPGIICVLRLSVVSTRTVGMRIVTDVSHYQAQRVRHACPIEEPPAQ